LLEPLLLLLLLLLLQLRNSHWKKLPGVSVAALDGVVSEVHWEVPRWRSMLPQVPHLSVAGLKCSSGNSWAGRQLTPSMQGGRSSSIWRQHTGMWSNHVVKPCGQTMWSNHVVKLMLSHPR